MSSGIIVKRLPPVTNIVITNKTIGKVVVSNVGNRVAIIDNLTSDSATAALSASMGKVLNDTKFTDINTDLLSLYRLAKGE